MKLIIQNRAHQKIRAYVDNCKEEISGLGRIVLNENKDAFIVSDVEILEQSVGPTHAALTAPTLAKFQAQKVKKKESLKEYCFWWHSHAAMDAFFSGTDTGTIAGSTEFPYLVSYVTNHKGAHKARFDILNPFPMTVELQIEIEAPPTDADLIERCKEEIEEKITFPKKAEPIAPPYRSYDGTGSFTGYSRSIHDDAPRFGFQRLPSPEEKKRSESLKTLKERRDELQEEYKRAQKKGKSKQKLARIEDEIAYIYDMIADIIYDGNGHIS
jgi:hypothetical protein